MSFVVKNYTFEDELNDMLDKYDEFLKKNNLDEKEELIESINNFSKKMENYYNFSFLDQFFK